MNTKDRLLIRGEMDNIKHQLRVLDSALRHGQIERVRETTGRLREVADRIEALVTKED